MSEHIETKHLLKEDIKTFADMLKSPYLSEQEKEILQHIYIDEMDYFSIGELMNISDSTVKKKHCKILKKVNKILQAGL